VVAREYRRVDDDRLVGERPDRSEKLRNTGSSAAGRCPSRTFLDRIKLPCRSRLDAVVVARSLAAFSPDASTGGGCASHRRSSRFRDACGVVDRQVSPSGCRRLRLSDQRCCAEMRTIIRVGSKNHSEWPSSRTRLPASRAGSNVLDRFRNWGVAGSLGNTASVSFPLLPRRTRMSQRGGKAGRFLTLSSRYDFLCARACTAASEHSVRAR